MSQELEQQSLTDLIQKGLDLGVQPAGGHYLYPASENTPASGCALGLAWVGAVGDVQAAYDQLESHYAMNTRLFRESILDLLRPHLLIPLRDVQIEQIEDEIREYISVPLDDLIARWRARGL